MLPMTNDFPETKEVKRGPCPSCTSSDAYIEYDDGHGHCFSCNYHKRKDKDTDMAVTAHHNKTQPLSQAFRGNNMALTDRNILQNTANKYGVTATHLYSLNGMPYWSRDMMSVRGSRSGRSASWSRTSLETMVGSPVCFPTTRRVMT